MSSKTSCFISSCFTAAYSSLFCYFLGFFKSKFILYNHIHKIARILLSAGSDNSSTRVIYQLQLLFDRIPLQQTGEEAIEEEERAEKRDDM